MHACEVVWLHCEGPDTCVCLRSRQHGVAVLHGMQSGAGDAGTQSVWSRNPIVVMVGGMYITQWAAPWAPLHVCTSCAGVWCEYAAFTLIQGWWHVVCGALFMRACMVQGCGSCSCELAWCMVHGACTTSDEHFCPSVPAVLVQMHCPQFEAGLVASALWFLMFM